MQEEYLKSRLAAIRQEIALLEEMMEKKAERKRKSSFLKHLEETYTTRSWRKPDELKKNRYAKSPRLSKTQQ